MRVAGSTSILHAAERSPPLLQVAGLSKRYGEQLALADISLSLRAGEVLGVIGPNGAGKTTLLEMIAGLTPADSGEMHWAGGPLAHHQRRAHMLYLPDGLWPWDEQYVVQVLGFIASAYGRTPDEVAIEVKRLGLAAVLDKRIAVLSKGYARRLMLALGLLAPHPVLLMDEPFDGFDLRQTREIMTVIRDTARAGRSLVLAIHQLVDAERICDRLVLLADGRLRGAGTLAELRARAGLESGSLEDIFLALT